MRDIPVVGWFALIVVLVEVLQEAFPEIRWIGIAVLVVGAVAKWVQVYAVDTNTVRSMERLQERFQERSKLRRWLG